MNIYDSLNMEFVGKMNGINLKKIKSNFGTEIVKLKISAGAELPAHSTPVDVIFYVEKGEGILQIGEEKEIIKEGNFVDSPKVILHGWKNESNQDLEIIVFKLFTK